MYGLSLDKRQLCKIQGRLFENSARMGFDSIAFVDAFMASDTAAALDRDYDRLQWAGEEYIIAEFLDEVGEEALRDAGEADGIWPLDALYWTGWLYRLWHYLTGESSAEISHITDAPTMLMCWPGYHTLDPEIAIERFRDGHKSQSNSRTTSCQ